MQRMLRIGAGAAAAVSLLALGPFTAPAAWGSAPGDPTRAGTSSSDAAGPESVWVWPVDPPFRVTERFVAPAHDYAPGHRGIDLLPLGGAEVRAPAPGVIAFSGDVAGRGILTIDHGDGLVTTLEPVLSELSEGTGISEADVVGSVSLGGHAEPGTLHFGVRLDGRYINPMLLLGGVPRAVLVPCCDPL